MEYYDHALMGTTVALATGTYRRQSWGIVVMAAAAGALPDWDAVPYPQGTPGYSSVHRVWGHNLLVAPLLSAGVGAVGYLCWLSTRRPAEGGKSFSLHALTVWVLVGVLAALSHLLADVCYCGSNRLPEWPVLLFWPFSRWPWALPVVPCPWTDRGVTWILSGVLTVVGLRALAHRPEGAAVAGCWRVAGRGWLRDTPRRPGIGMKLERRKAMLRFEGDKTFTQPLDLVWSKLTDARFVIQCVPDVDKVTGAEPEQAELTIRPGLAFVRGNLDTTVSVHDKNEPASFQVTLVSKGIGSSSTVGITMTLAAADDGGTRVHWVTEVKELTGLLRLMPSGLIQGAAQRVIADVWARVEQKLREEQGTAP